MKTLVPISPTTEEMFSEAKQGDSDLRSIQRADTLSKIRDGEIENPGLVEPLKRALAAEKQAAEQNAIAQAAREEAEAIQLEWEALVSTFEQFATRIELGRSTIQDLRNRIETVEAEVDQRIGTMEGHRPQTVVDLAIEAFKGRSAIPLLESALGKVTDDFKSHVKAMRIFGQKNGVPREVLKELPND